VITLPVFLFIFGGVMKLYGLFYKGTEVKREAYVEMWNETVASQKEVIPGFSDPSGLPTDPGLDKAARYVPATGAAQAATWHTMHNSSATDLAFDLLYDVPVGAGGESTLSAAGHMQNSWLRTKPYQWLTIELPWNKVNDDMWDNPAFTVHPSVPDVFAGEGLDGDGTIYTQQMLDDSLSANKPSYKGHGMMGFANKAFDMAGVRPALGAGMRYGVIGGASEGTYELPGPDAEMAADYHVAAPPRSSSRYLSIAIIRAMFGGDRDQSFNSHILKFEMEPQIEKQASGNDFDTSDCEEMQGTLDGLNPDGGMSPGALLDIGDVLKGAGDGCGGQGVDAGIGKLEELFSGSQVSVPTP
jgi:hypothetical protein